MIFNKEQKISLYADYTILYLVAEDNNLSLALNTLQEFYQISSLEINIEKNKIIKNVTFCHMKL